VGCRPIIVLGPERSGTSLVASMIDKWGAYVGAADELSDADERNPRGYWEYKPLWHLLEEIGDLRSGVSWWEATFAERVSAKTSDPRLADEARRLIERMESPERPWMWKDPALCHFLGFWTAFWDDPVYVLTVRHPLDIARSWQAFGASLGRVPTSMTCNLLRWQFMAMTAMAVSDRTDRAADSRIFVDYERLLDSPSAEAARLAEFLDPATRTTTSDETVADMASLCDAEMRHHRSTEREHTAELTESQLALYDAQRRYAADVDFPFDATKHPMPAGWRELVINEELRAERSSDQTSSFIDGTPRLG
jgi:hypothetical protein